MDVAGRLARGVTQTVGRLGDLFPYAEIVYLGSGKTLVGELTGLESGTPEGRTEMSDVAELIFLLVKNGVQNRAEAEKARGPNRPQNAPRTMQPPGGRTNTCATPLATQLGPGSKGSWEI